MKPRYGWWEGLYRLMGGGDLCGVGMVGLWGWW